MTVCSAGVAIAGAVAWWSLLSSRERERVAALTAELVGRFRWEAAKGFGLTEPMRVAIAAQGALMLAELGDDGALDSVGTVIVHRSTVVRGGERSAGRSSPATRLRSPGRRTTTARS